MKVWFSGWGEREVTSWSCPRCNNFHTSGADLFVDESVKKHEKECFVEFPEILYVTEEEKYYYGISSGYKHLVGNGDLDKQVRDDDEDHTVAVYQLVRVDKYKKMTTRTSVVQKVL